MRIKIIFVMFDLFVYKDALALINKIVSIKSKKWVDIDFQIIVPMKKKNSFSYDVNKFLFYDDEYFDYSTYELGLHDYEEYDGFLFINDTFLLKNYTSKNYNNLFKIIESMESDMGYPIMIGPYHKPYISTSGLINSEFIPTYYFS